MAIRVAVATDKPRIVALYNAGPMATAFGLVPVTYFDKDFARAAGNHYLVNESGTALTACVLAFEDRSSFSPAIYYQLMLGSSLISVGAVLKAIATRGITAGLATWFASVPQHPALATPRAYLEARWPYLHNSPGDSDAGRPFRLMGDTLASVGVRA